MSVKIKLKHSSTAGKVPTAGDLDAGEVALNTSDVKAYIKNAGGAVVQLAGSGADATKVDKAGDTMTGALVLPAAAPTADAEAANKKYVDDQIVAGNLWSRTGTVVSPKTAGDDVTTTGDVNAADMTATGAVNAASVVATGDVQAASFNGGQLAGLRNQIINGDFRIWQRGAAGYFNVGATISYQSADRWGIVSIASGNHLARSSASPAGFDYSATIDAQANATIRHRIELFDGKAGPFIAGSTWTLSVWANNQIRARVQDSNANVSLPMGDMTATAKTSNGFTRYVESFTMAAGASGTYLEISLQNQNGISMNVVGVQLEPGPVATPFEHRPIGLELALCQRYYQQTPGRLGAASTQVEGSSGVIYSYALTMRTAPTITSPSTVGFIAGSTNSSSSWLKTTSTYIEQIFLDAEL